MTTDEEYIAATEQFVKGAEQLLTLAKTIHEHAKQHEIPLEFFGVSLHAAKLSTASADLVLMVQKMANS